MNYFSPFSRIALPVVAAGVLFVSCSDDKTDNPVNPGDNNPPAAYTFNSRFQSGASSVTYAGQTVRQLQLQDLKSIIDRAGAAGNTTAVTLEELNNLYNYSDALDLRTLTTVEGAAVKEDRYTGISTGKNLKGKISPAVMLGGGLYGGTTADQLIQQWFGAIAQNSMDPQKVGTPAVYISENGVDFSQMINKLLMGAVSYYQATGVYLANITNQDNTTAETGAAHTKMEHNWDEAFGYFGAARNYKDYTDQQLAASSSAQFAKDANSDGKIDFESEYNFGFARNAGKRDQQAAANGSATDFTKDIFEAFVKGRHVIATQGTRQSIEEQRLAASQAWEKSIAATLVHYINETLSDMGNIGTGAYKQTDHSKHWSEMRGFSLALQFNATADGTPTPFRTISTADLQQLYSLLGDAPVFFATGTTEGDAYKAKLEQAKTLLKQVYGFTDANMAGW